MAARKLDVTDPKLNMFCANLVKGMNAVEAAVDAGYSRTYAAKNACRLKDSPVCKEILAAMMARTKETLTLDAVRVVNEMGAIAMMSPLNLVVEDPRATGDFFRWKRPDELTAMEKAAIRSVEIYDQYEDRVDDNGNTVRVLVKQEFRYVLHDKMKALDALGRHFNIYAEIEDPSKRAPLPDFSKMPHDKMMALMNYMQKLQSEEEAVDGEVLSDD